jgi:uncharacterized membrane protein (DUF485 family)
MRHEPASSLEPDHAIGYKKRVGVIMFLMYSLFYAGFVIVNLANPLAMEMEIFGGLNLAVVYGFGLIVVALVLALIYNTLCGLEEKRLNGTSCEGGKK